MRTMAKCQHPGGITIKPNGKDELDPCDYELTEKWKNVTIEVLRCQRCGHVELLWHLQEDSENITEEENGQ